jgi:membrane-bound ClpP family serine protease
MEIIMGKVLLLIGFIVLMFIIGPALFIWGSNELLEQAGFSQQIPWNFWTWLAAWIVMPKVTTYKHSK